MSTKPLVPTGEIPRNSNAAEYVRASSEKLLECMNEIDSATETLNDPFKTSAHLMKAQRHAHAVEVMLIATGIPKLRQDALDFGGSNAQR